MLANITTASWKALAAEALLSQHVAGAHVTACSQQVLGRKLLNVCVRVYVQAGRGYLSAVPVGEFSQLCEGHLPTAMMGADFLHQYWEHYDQQTQVVISSCLILPCCVDIACTSQLTGIRSNWLSPQLEAFVCHEQSCI